MDIWWVWIRAHLKVCALNHAIGYTYPGLPGPVICDFMTREDSRQRYDDGVEFSMERIELLGNTGTWLDSPFHRFTDGADLSALMLENLAHLDR